MAAKSSTLAEMEKREAINERVCKECRADIMGEVNKLQFETYLRTGLCPECYDRYLLEMRKPDIGDYRQIGLPIIGSMPSIIEMNPISFGTMCATDSYLLKDCIIDTKWNGKTCHFNIICPHKERRDAIAKFLGQSA